MAEKSKEPWPASTILLKFSCAFFPSGAGVFELSMAFIAIERSFNIRSAEKPGLKSLSAGLIGPTLLMGQ